MIKTLLAAIGEFGVTAKEGAAHNKRIIEYFAVSNAKYVNDDETPWCAAFVNWCLAQGGHVGTKRLNARSFLDYGEKVEEPKLGDIVILWRKSKLGVLGHVGFYVGETTTGIKIYGGNQDNAVNIKVFPKDRLLGYRRIPATE